MPWTSISAMIRKAHDYLSPEKRNGISFFVGDVVRLPYQDRTMDAVFGFGVLHHIPDWQGALAEIVRVLKPGGIYFFEELYPTLYQNIITRHILLHPTDNRFRSQRLERGAERGRPGAGKLSRDPEAGNLRVCDQTSVDYEKLLERISGEHPYLNISSENFYFSLFFVAGHLLKESTVDSRQIRPVIYRRDQWFIV